MEAINSPLMRISVICLTACLLSGLSLAAPPKKKKQIDNPRALPEVAYRSNAVFSLHEAAATGNIQVLKERLAEARQSGQRNAYSNPHAQRSAPTPHIDINQKDEFGNTALHIATKANQQEVIKLLLQAGASRSIKNNEGQTP